MASFVALTVIFGFYAVLCYIQLQLLRGGGADTMTLTMAQDEAFEISGGIALVRRAAAASLVPAVMATLTLTPLLAFAHVRQLVVVRAKADNGGGGSGAGARLVAGLATVTIVVATTALVAAAVVQLGADGHLDRGRGDVARLNIK